MPDRQSLSAADLITRREAIQRVSLLLGGAALVGGDALLTGCRDRGTTSGGAFTVVKPPSCQIEVEMLLGVWMCPPQTTAWGKLSKTDLKVSPQPSERPAPYHSFET